MIRRPIPRRTFLRGLGTAVALPLLDSMLPAHAMAAGATRAAAKTAPKRLAFVFVPNGIHMPAWTPAVEGPGFELPFILEPLQNVKDHLMVLTNLAQNKAAALGDGGGDHARSAAVWLTGVHPKKTAGADIRAGISVDQVAALAVGQRTRFPSLELGCERGAMNGNCDSGYSCAYSSNIAWHAADSPLAKEVNPRSAFDRLFGTGSKDEAAEAAYRREHYRQSILDFVMEDASSLKSTLGRHDQHKMDEYLTGVREIERRVVMAENEGAVHIPGVTRPTGIPLDFGEHIRLMGDIMVLAFQTDLTRISTLMIANDGSNRAYREVNIPEGHHDCSHHGGDKIKQDKIQHINRYHMTQFAYILEKMNSIQEGDGTLLDHSMIVYGAGISDGDRHNHDELPILLAGKGGGTLKTGQHMRFAPETPMNNLFLSLLDRMDVHPESLGDSTGRLQQLV